MKSENEDNVKYKGNKNNSKLAEDEKTKSEEGKINKNKTKEEDVDLESVLSDLKIFGRYHLRFIFLIGMLSLGSSWHSTNYVFAVENVAYRCKYSNCNATEISKLDLNSNLDYKCHKYKLFDNNGTCSKENFDVSDATVCNEWVYDKPDSFVAEFNLGCEDWKRTLVGTMHSVGYMLGLLLVGPISDKYGRKNLIIFTSIACAVIGMAKSMVYSYWLYVTLEMLEPLLGDCYSATFTLAVETVTKEYRPLIIVILSVFSTIGGIILALIAWLSPNWRIFLIAIYAPGLLFILYIFWIDESVRWLLNQGRKSEVDGIIRQAAKTNNLIIDENKLSRLKCGGNASNASLRTLMKMTFSSKRLFFRLLCCVCMWFTTLFNAYGLLINSVSLKGNKYLNFVLTVSTGLPACVVIFFLLTKCKRQKPLIFSFLLTGTFCTAHSIVPADYAWVSILLYICGKFTSCIAMRIVYIYTSELFPTYTRNTMHALCSALGRTAAIIAPQTSLLIEYWPGLPSLIMGILSLLTAGVVTLMPNTADDVLPDNVREAEAIGKKEKEVELCSRL